VIDRYRQIFLSLSDAVFIEDSAGSIVDANTAASWLLGSPREHLLGRKMHEFIAAASLERLIEQRSVLKTVERHQFDTQCRKADGALVNVILDISLIPELSTETEGSYLIVARPASKRDELERELRLQRQCTQGLNTAACHTTFFISSRNDISRYPPLGPAEPPGPLDWTVALLHRDPLKAELERAWTGNGATVGPAWFSPIEVLGRDSASHNPLLHQRWLRIRIQPIRLRGAEVTDLCVRIADETELLLQTEEGIFSSRQACVTLLSAAIFHEFNNYLGVILAQASGLRLTTPAGELPAPGIGAIVDASQKAAGLLRRTSDSVMDKGDAAQPHNLNDILRECAPLLAYSGTEQIRMSLEMTPNLPLISGHRHLLRTLILAIGRHALSRLHGIGRLTVKTFAVPPVLPELPVAAGLSFSASAEHGAPMSQPADEPMEVILAKSILRVHAGQLETISTDTQGTIWELTLPGFQDAPRSTGKGRKSSGGLPVPQSMLALSQSAAASESQPKGKVLLADDEENFRMFTSWVLRERGYEVVVAKDGLEAFERFQETPDAFALVILDAYMPRMGGLEAYLRMQVLRSDLPVLFASGFARGASIEALVSGCPGPAGVLLKPFSSEDLLEAVKKALRPRT